MKKIFTLVFTLCVSLLLTAQNTEFKILVTNDMHSGIQNFGKLAYVVDSLRTLYPNLLIFSAGDNRTGNPVNDIYTTPNQPMVELMNKVGFNMSGMGNHECDGGVEGFRYSVNNSNFPYVCGNAFPADSLKLHIRPFMMFEQDGVRLSVLGLVQVGETMTPDAHPSLLKGIRFTKPEVEAHKYEWLRQVSDVYCFLTHCGIEQDTLLADEFGYVDAIFGGHSHDNLKGIMRNNVMITQAVRDCKYAAEVTIVVRDHKVVERRCNIIDVRAAKGVNKEVQEMVDKFSDNPVLKRRLTTALNPFNKEELGILMSDAIREITGADIAIQNPGGVRMEDKEAGDFIVNDVFRLDPFGNTAIMIEVSGEQLEKILAEIPIIDGYGAGYVSGIKYTIDKDKKNPNKYKAVITNEDGSKFNKKKIYKVVMNDYLATIHPLIDWDKDVKSTYKTTAECLITFLEGKSAIDYKGRHNTIVINVKGR